MKTVLAAVVLSFIAFVVTGAMANADAPRVTDLRLQAPADLTVGDRFTYLVVVEADRGTSVDLAANGVPPELSVTRPPEVRTRPLSNGRIEHRLTIEVAAFVPGEFTVDPLMLSYREANGATGVVETRTSLLVVNSVLPESGEVTLRDLKPQMDIPSSGASLLLPSVAGAILVVALAVTIWRLRSRRPQPVAAPAVVSDAPSIEDQARAALDQAAAEFESDADYAAFYLAIAVTVRSYLTQRFGFPAFALTTSELQEAMVGSGVDRWQARIAGNLLAQCDSVIYAHYRPAAERADADLTAAYEIVEMTRSAEEAAVP
jgi:hypothetical protein